MENKNRGKKTIYYIGNIGYKNTAMAIHVRNLGYLFKKLNYDVIFFCENWNDNCRYSSDEDFTYFYTNKYLNISKLSALEWLYESLTGTKLYNLVYKKVKLKKPDFIILYGYEGEKKLIDLCKQENIPIILERCDWFEKEDRVGFLYKNFIHYISEFSIQKLDIKADGIIAISKYLRDYYQNKGKKVEFIPPIFKIDPMFKIERYYNNDNSVHLVYAGSMGGYKDQTLLVLEVLKEINKQEIKIFLDIVGTSMEEIEKITECKVWNRYGVKAYGRLSNEDTKKIVRRADFSLLLRQNKRYAKAGFSTKFAESMCLGVPVICTKVGGSDSVITHMKDGIHLIDNSYETILSVLKEILKMDCEKILEIKNNAFLTAQKLFSLEVNIEKMANFLEIIKDKREN